MDQATILVVEDNEDIREALMDLLGDAGYAAVGAANGREALSWLRRGGRPAVILLDWSMPIMDGRAFLEEQDQDADLSTFPVIVVTAGADLAGLQRSRPVMKKPVEFEKLLEAISDHRLVG